MRCISCLHFLEEMRSSTILFSPDSLFLPILGNRMAHQQPGIIHLSKTTKHFTDSIIVI